MAVPDALVAAERVPHVVPLQPAPDRVQVTPLPALSFVTVAVNSWVCATCTDIVAGDIATEMGVATLGAASWFDPPPQPDSNPTVTSVNANNDCTACPACTRIKAVSLSVGVLEIRLRGGWKLRFRKS
jgi:hypothetical protein